MKRLNRNWVCLHVLCAALAAAPALAHGQYKWVGPDGRITYSDRPPPEDATLASKRQMPAADDQGDPTLPYALRTLAKRHPVVLYTTRDCQPCSQARSHLFKRGIPFAEKVVATRDDADAYRALGFGDLSFPAVSIGRQRSSGFEAGAWDRLLDTAGYPKSSLLTASYRYPAAEPLAAQPQQVAPPPEPAERAEAAPPARVARPTPQRAAPPAPAPDQPTIRF